jgi:UDP-2,4-diacetamido-2,4,6-trideoxy-beta-L-altropyranose hydrolase
VTLAEELLMNFEVSFIIRSDDETRIRFFILENLNSPLKPEIIFLEYNVDINTEINCIEKKVINKDAFLILDHYGIDETYQLALLTKGIRWLQFDSHARQKFYGNIILHASPGVKEAVYRSLLVRNNSKLLLGTQYAIVNKKFLRQRQNIETRKCLRNFFICFGGGNDRGATYTCLKALNERYFESYNFHIFSSSKNLYFSKIQEFVEKHRNVELKIDATDVERAMAGCDLAIIAPGTLSYESACLGLPMLLITIADNQEINAIGWESIGAAISLGDVGDLSAEILNGEIASLLRNPENLSAMSQSCFQHVDGLGVERVKNELVSIL